ncbi:hypothetical protein ABK040_009558 [Willaertia magna]
MNNRSLLFLLLVLIVLLVAFFDFTNGSKNSAKCNLCKLGCLTKLGKNYTNCIARCDSACKKPSITLTDEQMDRLFGLTDEKQIQSDSNAKTLSKNTTPSVQCNQCVENCRKEKRGPVCFGKCAASPSCRFEDVAVY